jgi:glycerophosphoryl diester phosphodiesterase
MKGLLVSMLLLSAVSMAGCSHFPIQEAQADEKTQMVAHRGYSSIAPENTASAFIAAGIHHADAIEYDIQISRDGVPVIIHDFSVDRTTNGKGKVKEKTFAELQGLNAGKGQKIPTLHDVLTIAQKYNLYMYPEIKGYVQEDDIDKMVQEVIGAGFEKRATMVSFHPGDLKHVRKLSKTLKIGYLVSNKIQFEAGLAEAKQQGNAIISSNYKVILTNPELVQQAHKADVGLAVWTVDSPEIAKQLEKLGVHKILTNKLINQ